MLVNISDYLGKGCQQHINIITLMCSFNLIFFQRSAAHFIPKS